MPMSTVPRIAGIRGHETIVDPHEAGAVLVGTPCKHSPADASWRIMVAPYPKPDARRAVIQLSTTGLLFLAVMAGMLTALEHGILAAMLLVPPAAILLVRLFMFQHDCGHGSFFAARRVNDRVGQLLGVLTLTAYSAWRDTHATHHASAGNLDRRGIGDVATLTVSEYAALPAWRRLAYRLYRHPLVMFGVAPGWLFLIRNRVPTGDPRRHWREWFSVVGTDAALGAVLATLVVTLGPLPVLLGGCRSSCWPQRLAFGSSTFSTSSRRRTGSPAGLGLSRGGAARRLVLRFAGGAALDDREYRVPPHPSSFQPDSELSPARMPCGEPRVAGGAEAHSAREPEMRAARALGCRTL